MYENYRKNDQKQALTSVLSSRCPLPRSQPPTIGCRVKRFPISPSEITMDAKMRGCDNGRGMLMRRRRLDRRTREENFARKIYELEETSTVTRRIRRPIC